MKACTSTQSCSSLGFVVSALMARTWTQHCKGVYCLPAVWSKPPAFQLMCMCVIRMSTHTYGLVCCFARGSTGKSWHPPMICQAPSKLISLFSITMLIFPQAKNSSLPINTHTHMRRAYIIGRGLTLILVPWAFSSRESTFRRCLVMQRKINVVWAQEP